MEHTVCKIVTSLEKSNTNLENYTCQDRHEENTLWHINLSSVTIILYTTLEIITVPFLTTTNINGYLEQQQLLRDDDTRVSLGYKNVRQNTPHYY